jgi:hypothetical protein
LDRLGSTDESFADLVQSNLQGPYFLTQGDRARSNRAASRRFGVRGVHHVHHVGVGGNGVGQSRRLLHQQDGPLDGRPPVRPAARRARHSLVRGAARYHRDRHDRGRPRDLRPPHRGRPRARTPLGAARRRRPRGGVVAAGRSPVRDRDRRSRRWRVVGTPALGVEKPLETARNICAG